MNKQAPLLNPEDDFDQTQTADDTVQEIKPVEVVKAKEPIPKHPANPGYVRLRTTINNDAGEWIDLTVERPDVEEATQEFEMIISHFAATLALTMARPTTVINGPHQSPPAPRPQGQQDAPAQARTATPEGIETGVMKLEKIVVRGKDRGDGQVTQFFVERFSWPLNDSRRPETVAALFDGHLGWTPEHFTLSQQTPVITYTPDQWGNHDLWVYWHKPEKYRNIIRISDEKDDNYDFSQHSA